MTSQVDICNRALAAAGAREQITSFTEGSASSINCNLLFTPTFEQLGRTAYWNCLRYQAPLTLLKAAQGTPENQTGSILPIPPQPWLYEYLLPNDCLMVRYLQPTYAKNSGSIPIFPTASSIPPSIGAPQRVVDFAVGVDSVSNSLTKVILTNLSTAQIVYTQNNPNPDFWESEFQAAMAASLAAFLIPALNLNMSLLNIQTRLADQIIQQARAADGNEGVVSQNRDASWILARGCGNEIDTGYYGNYSYNNMCWPGGY